MKIFNAYSTVLFIQLIIINMLLYYAMANTENEIIPNWNMYRTTPDMLIFNNPSSQEFVAFKLNHKQYQVTWNDGANQIIIGQKNSFEITLRSLQTKVDIMIDSKQQQNNRLSFLTNIKSTNCTSAITQISLQNLQQQNFKPSTCNFPTKISNQQSKLTQSWQVIMKQFDNKVSKYIQAKKIKKQYKNLIKFSLMELYSSITYTNNNEIGINFCFRNSQAQDYFGIYSLPHNRCDRKLALLSLDILYDIDPSTAKWLYNDFMVWLDNQLRYATFDNRIVQAPQHIESIIKFFPNYRNNNAKNILLSYISNILLKSVSHLEEQINYRQSNQLHPSLLKMMTLNYQAYSPYLKQISVYHESFLEDMFYHGNQFSVQLAITKYCYLVKLATFASYYLNQQATVDAFYFKSHPDELHAQTAKNTIVEINSLVNIIKIFMQPSEDGIIKSVVKDSNQNKLYVTESTYEKFFPHLIGISNKFPNSTLKDLLTPHGIASGKSSSDNYDIENYRYRGRIHLYFNYKILKHQPITDQLQITWKNIQTDIIEEWNKNKQISTAWDNKRVSKQHQKHLKIIAAAFLVDTEQIERKNINVDQKQKQQSKQFKQPKTQQKVSEELPKQSKDPKKPKVLEA